MVGIVIGATDASAQECQTRPLPFGTEQYGELEDTDCRLPAASCSDCVSVVPGEYWVIDARVGDLVVVTVNGRPAVAGGFTGAGAAYLRDIYDSTGRRVQGWPADEGGLRFKAEATGPYRALIVEGGYMREHFGVYTIRAQRELEGPPSPSGDLRVQTRQLRLRELA